MNARASSVRTESVSVQTVLPIGLTFNQRALLITIALFCVEVSIATVFRHIGWLRGFVGDALAVVFVYYGFKTIFRAPTLWLAIAALLVGYGVELSQYISHLQGWKISNPVLRIVVGSTPDWWDVLAYTVGFCAVWAIESAMTRRSNLFQT
jgi:Protein of unknown function (DUF2809)